MTSLTILNNNNDFEIRSISASMFLFNAPNHFDVLISPTEKLDYLFSSSKIEIPSDTSLMKNLYTKIKLSDDKKARLFHSNKIIISN